MDPERRVIKDGAVAVENTRILAVGKSQECARAHRYSAGKDLLEIPAGTLEPGETVEECVKRELREETGYEAGEIRRLLSCFMAPGYSSEVIHFYIARDLVEVGGAPEPDEEIDVEVIDLKKVRELIAGNVIEDAKTIIGILSLDERHG